MLPLASKVNNPVGIPPSFPCPQKYDFAIGRRTGQTVHDATTVGAAARCGAEEPASAINHYTRIGKESASAAIPAAAKNVPRDFRPHTAGARDQLIKGAIDSGAIMLSGAVEISPAVKGDGRVRIGPVVF